MNLAKSRGEISQDPANKTVAAAAARRIFREREKWGRGKSAAVSTGNSSSTLATAIGAETAFAEFCAAELFSAEPCSTESLSAEPSGVPARWTAVEIIPASRLSASGSLVLKA